MRQKEVNDFFKKLLYKIYAWNSYLGDASVKTIYLFLAYFGVEYATYTVNWRL
jgi:hypothetical protein